jgi:hypothetical protein
MRTIAHPVPSGSTSSLRNRCHASGCSSGVRGGARLFLSAFFTPKQQKQQILLRVPHLFACRNVLSLPRTDIRADTVLTLSNMVVAGAEADTHAHVDKLGVGAACFLAGGVKVWLIAPPERTKAFHALFPDSQCIPWADLGRPQWQETMTQQGVTLVVHRADELLWLPSGWPHAVFHVTRTTMISCSVVLPHSLPTLLSYVEDGDDHSQLDLPALMRALQSHPLSVGVTQADADAAAKRCAAALKLSLKAKKAAAPASAQAKKPRTV